jgi:hypothetical protein
MAMNSIQIESNWQDEREGGFAGDSMRQVWVINELEKLCFTCPLKECKEDSKKCPINIAKAEKKASKKAVAA